MILQRVGDVSYKFIMHYIDAMKLPTVFYQFVIGRVKIKNTDSRVTILQLSVSMLYNYQKVISKLP